jgi:hypothetical protein
VNRYGAFFYATVPKTLKLYISAATFDTNTANDCGGLIYFDGSGSGSSQITIDSSSITTVSSTIGSGGVVASSSNTVGTSIIISRSTVDTCWAKYDGGVVYLLGTGTN